MLVQLSGKTNHGKNRIREHGSSWMVQDLPTGVISANPMPTRKTLVSVLTGAERWVSMTNDKDFIIA